MSPELFRIGQIDRQLAEAKRKGRLAHDELATANRAKKQIDAEIAALESELDALLQGQLVLQARAG